jgi:GAF domain-containing protein
MKTQSLHKVRELLDVLERTTGEPGDLTGTLQHIAQTSQKFFAADACVIFAINPITNRFLTSLAVAGDLLEEQVFFEQPRAEGIAPQVLKHGVLSVEDVGAEPEYQSKFTRAEAIRSFVGLALQMRYRQKPLGVLYINFRQKQRFSDDDHELFQLFAEQASYILQETWLLRRYQEVARIGQEINQEHATADILFQRLQKHIAGIVDTSHLLLLAIYHQQTNTLDLYLEQDGTFTLHTDIPLKGVCQYVIETQQTLAIPQLSKEDAEHLPFQLLSITGNISEESLIFVPLILRDVSLGVLSIQHPQPNAYNQEDQFILELLANHITLALHNIRLHSNLNQLNETGQLLTQQLESEHTLQTTVDKICDVTRADLVVLYPYEPAFQRFMLPPRIAGELLGSTIQSLYPSRPDDIATLMLRSPKPIFAKKGTNVYTQLRSNEHIQQGNFGQREQIHSTAALPLRIDNESVGVLFVNFRQPQRFDATQELLIEGLAHYAAIAIKNAQIFGKLSQRRLHELEILQKIDRELSSTLDLESVLNTLLRLACEQIPAENASILLYNPRLQSLEASVATGPHAGAIQKHFNSLHEAKGITYWVLEYKKPARVDNIHRDQQWQGLYIQTAPDTISELDIPLLDSEDVVGVLNFESTREAAFGQEDEYFLINLAGQAVLAIKNAQAYEREKRLAEERRVLNEISKQITSQLDLNRVFDLILEKALELTHSTLGSVHLYYPDLKGLHMEAERGVSREKKGLHQRLGEGVVGHVAKNKRLQNVGDVTQYPWNEIYLEFVPGAHSELAVPMLAGDELRGVLNVESPALNNFSQRDERLLQGLADLAVIALQNAQAYEREKRLAAEARVLNEISKQITSQLDLNRVFDLILEKALELTHSHMGNLMLYDPTQNDLWMAAERSIAEGKRGQRQRLDQGVVGYVARIKRLLNADLTQPPWNEIYLEFFPGALSELAAPMLAGDKLRGVLNVESPNPNNFSERDEHLLQGLADLAVVALQNAERYEQAESEAHRLELLYRAGQELGKIADLAQLEQAYDIILRIAEEHSRGQVIIRRYDPDTQELVSIWTFERQRGGPLTRTKLYEGVGGQVARERRTIVIHDVSNLPPGVASPQLSDPLARSLLITPIMFEDRYYGNLGLSHHEADHFRGTDELFFEGLAQQLANTIYRMETVQARQESEQRAKDAEAMGSLGQTAFELTHRWGNDLGLVASYVNDVRSELETLDVTSTFISKKLDNIVRATGRVLALSKDVKQVFGKLGASMHGKPMDVHPRLLFEAAQDVPSLSPTIQICLEIDEDVAAVRVIHSSAADILRNLVANAIDALPEGGKITLKARNTGRFVALEVADTGIGIPEQNLSKVFDLFYSTKGSSGFGLWSARTNALRNHGDLTVKSQADQGTTFTLLLPREEGEPS